MAYTIEQLYIGQTESVRKVFTIEDVISFAELTGDINPVHIDEIAAKSSVFGQRIVHGAFVSSLISAVLGNKLPGNGTVYLGQESKFVAPVYINDTITATCEVIEVIKNKNIVKLKCVIVNQNDKIVIEGKATVMPPKILL